MDVAAWLRPRKGQSTQSEGDATGGRGGAQNIRRVWSGQSGDLKLTERNKDLFGTTKYRTFQTMRRAVPVPSAYCALVESLAAKAKFDIDAPEDRVNAVLHHDDLKTPWAQTKVDMVDALLSGYSLCEWITERVNGMYRIIAIRRIPQSSIFEFRLGEHQDVEYFVQYGTGMHMIRRWQTLYTVVGAGIEGHGVLLNMGDRALKFIRHDRDLESALSANLRDVPDVTAPGKALEAESPVVKSLKQLISIKDRIRNPRMLTPSDVYSGDSSSGGVTFAPNTPQYGVMQHKPIPISDNDRLMAYNRELALAVNAEALLLGVDGAGSLALSRTQATMFYDSVDGVLARMADEIQRMLRVVFRFNGWADEVRVTVDNSAWVDPKDLADGLSTLKDVPMDQFKPAIEDVMKRMGLALKDKGAA